jgi:hypothetical protein
LNAAPPMMAKRMSNTTKAHSNAISASYLVCNLPRAFSPLRRS